jgi:hypothetical protein
MPPEERQASASVSGAAAVLARIGPDMKTSAASSPLEIGARSRSELGVTGDEERKVVVDPAAPRKL